MKLGCFGCLFLIIAIFTGSLLIGGAIFVAINVFGTPDLRPASFSSEDGDSAQQKLYEVLLRQSGRSSRKNPITLGEREANAFLSHHLAEAAGLPLSPLALRFERGQLLAQGQTPLRHLFRGPLLARLLPYLPDNTLDQPVWVTIRGKVGVDASTATHYGTVSLTEFELGRQRLSRVLLYVMMGPSGAGLFRWRVPSVVESIEISDGHATIRTR
ncbi:MAG: hypothetical protein C5B48_00745 [Candidatus Rokuibacteriota bacterium]|nr:MAG: hypothetical protein C5B48_00745 [Candidatus Rokubacteria bacterium]